MICGVCYEQEIEVQLSPQECYCERCLLSWTKESIEQNMANLNEITVPALQDPDLKYTLIQVLNVLSPTATAQIQALLFKRYLMHSDNLLQCNACDYYGFISETQQDCKFPFQCEKCCTQWVPKCYESYQKKCFIVKFFDQTMTNLNKVATGQPCPFCQAIIYKNGGCPYVQCTKCKTEFCWNCMKDYHFHLAQIQFCPQRHITLFAIYFLLLLAVFSKLSVNSPLLYYIESIVVSSIVYVLTMIGSLLIFLLYLASFPITVLVLINIFKFCSNLFYNCRHRGKRINKLSCFFTCCCVWLFIHILIQRLYLYTQAQQLYLAIQINWLIPPAHLLRKVFNCVRQRYRMRRIKRRL